MTPSRDRAYIWHFPIAAAIKAATPADWPRWRAIPVDLAVGRRLGQTLVDLKNDTSHKAAFGSPVATVAAPSDLPNTEVEQRAGEAPPTSPATLDTLRAEVATWSPADRAALRDYLAAEGVNKEDPLAVAAAMAHVRGFHDVVSDPTPPAAPEVAVRPVLPTVGDEGDTIHPAQVDALKATYGKLDEAAKAWIRQIDADARRAGRSIRVNDLASVRRFELNSGLLALADNEFDDDDAVRAVCALTIGDELAQSMAFTVGALVGCHDVAEAKRFAAVVRGLLDGEYATHWEGKRMRLTPSEAA